MQCKPSKNWDCGIVIDGKWLIQLDNCCDKSTNTNCILPHWQLVKNEVPNDIAYDKHGETSFYGFLTFPPQFDNDQISSKCPSYKRGCHVTYHEEADRTAGDGGRKEVHSERTPESKVARSGQLILLLLA